MGVALKGPAEKKTQFKNVDFSLWGTYYCETTRTTIIYCIFFYFQKFFTVDDLEEIEQNKNDENVTETNLEPFLDNLILESFNSALNEKENELKKCDICDKEFGSSDELSAHTDFHVKCSTVAHLCTDCDLAFFKISEYVSHNIDVHESTSTSHKCDISCKKYELSSDFEKYYPNQFGPKTKASCQKL